MQFLSRFFCKAFLLDIKIQINEKYAIFPHIKLILFEKIGFIAHFSKLRKNPKNT